MKLAKVMTMETWLDKNGLMKKIVTTVDPSVTVDAAARMCGLTMMNIRKCEESDVMPLPSALEHASELRERFGIRNVVFFFPKQLRCS